MSRTAGAQLSEWRGSGAAQPGRSGRASGPFSQVVRSVEWAVGIRAGQSPVPKATKRTTDAADVTGSTNGSPRSPL